MPKIICASDLHLRQDRPRCRIDSDWMETQKKALKQLAEYSHIYKCDIAIIGDVFHTYKVPNEIINMFLSFTNEIYNNIGIMPGQHDLLFHSFEEINKSGFGVIWVKINSNNIKSLDYYGRMYKWGTEEYIENSNNKNDIYFIHQLTFENEESKPPNVEAVTAAELLRKYKEANFIITGDNHHKFYYKNNNRYVINIGSFLRTASDFIHYQPVVYFVDTEEEIVKELPIIDNEEMVTDAYIQKEKETNERLDALFSYIERIKTDENIDTDLDFKNALNKAIILYKSDIGTKKMIETLLEESK